MNKACSLSVVWRGIYIFRVYVKPKPFHFSPRSIFTGIFVIIVCLKNLPSCFLLLCSLLSASTLYSTLSLTGLCSFLLSFLANIMKRLVYLYMRLYYISRCSSTVAPMEPQFSPGFFTHSISEQHESLSSKFIFLNHSRHSYNSFVFAFCPMLYFRLQGFLALSSFILLPLPL